eukprot:13948970-Alexandrium_andersonii.AAC.1
MSASLVGSEMCIRDRRGWAKWPGPSEPVQGGEGLHEARWRRWDGVAVSYTHLTLPTICSV